MPREMRNQKFHYTRGQASWNAAGLRGQGSRGGALVQKGLQDEGGGDLVDEVFVLLAGVTGLVENLVGFAGGEALIPEVDGQTGERAQLGGELLHLGGAGADFAGEMQGVADHDARHGEAAGEAGDGTQIVAAVAAYFKGHHRLRGEAQLVGDGDADAFCSDVEGEIAGFGFH